jgi:hypothetical protein
MHACVWYGVSVCVCAIRDRQTDIQNYVNWILLMHKCIEIDNESRT